jgi:hypothetical protein
LLVTRIERYEPLPDRETVAIRLQRVDGISLFFLDVANFAQCHRQIALPFGVVWIVLRKARSDGVG